MTVTELRKNIYNVFDEVKKTGKPREVVMKGEKFIIKAVDSKNDKLERLKNWKPQKGTIIGDPEDLVDFKVWDIDKDWREPDIVAGKDI